MKPESTKRKTMAVCLYGLSENPTLIRRIKSEIRLRFTAFSAVFIENYTDQKLFKNLWLCSFKKQLLEREHKSNFAVCLAINIDSVVSLSNIKIPHNLNWILYYITGGYDCERGTYINSDILLAESFIFDRACDFGITDFPEEKFYYFLKTLKIKTSCVNYENRDLFKRPT